MKQRHTCTRLLLLLFVALVACQAGQAPTASPEPTSTVPPPTKTPEPTSTPLPTATATASVTPTPGPLSPSELFDKIAPSVAFVETGSTTGSGLYINNNFLLTNAHVVWPYQEARIVFADGFEVEAAPVYKWDLMADIALLGPLEGVQAKPLTLSDGEDLTTGSQVYLIGYPGEVERLPTPTITGGIIARQRQWEQEGITYFQTDADIAGGQSGGALVSDMGEVIGLSGFAFTEALFGLVASTADLDPFIQQLVSDDSVPGDHLMDHSKAANRHTFGLTNAWDSAAYILETLRNGQITITAESNEDIALSVVNRYGEIVGFADKTFSGEESVVITNPQGAHIVQISTYSRTGTSVTLTASGGARLIPITDRDDNRIINVDRPIRGTLDHPGDVDIFQLRLARGEIINLAVDSANIDALLTVTYPGAKADQAVRDDDSDGGFTGLNATLTYRAPHDGFYYVVVSDSNSRSMGGYTLLASSRRADAPTPIAPLPTEVPIVSPAGHPMYLQGEDEGFSIQTPAWWDPLAEGCASTACQYGLQGFLLILQVEDESIFAYLRSQLANNLAVTLEETLPLNAQQQQRSTVQTSGGELVERFHYLIYEGENEVHLIAGLAVRDGALVTMEYYIYDEYYEEMATVVDYSLSTFEWTE